MPVFRKHVIIAAILLISGGIAASAFIACRYIIPLLGIGLFEDRDNFITYIICSCSPIVPAIISIAFGIKLFINKDQTKKADELLECTVITSKISIVVFVLTLIYSIFITVGIGILGAALQRLMVSGIAYFTYGLIVPICAVISYFVVKNGIKKSKVLDVKPEFENSEVKY